MKLVTAIMPTRGRRELAKRALDCFLAQTYPHKEIVIADDADDPSFMWTSNDPPILRATYARLGERRSIAAKRNFCAEVARGEIIIHWDSDDFSASERIADQVRRLEESGKAVTGYKHMLFYDGETFGRYVGDPCYGLGTSLCYRRDWWQAHPFREHLTIGEDNDFVAEAWNAGQFISVPGDGMMVARVHADNTSKKNISDYRPVEPHMIPAEFAT